MDQVRVMETRNIDELIILDVNATLERRKPLFKEIELYNRELFCPLTVGGGITCLDDIGKLIQECGADKVAINTAALEDISLIEKAANKYGSQAIVGVVNAKANYMGYYVSNGVNNNYLDRSPFRYSLELHKAGCGEILLTSVDNNGTKTGYDIVLLHLISQISKVPIIINGGCGKISHMEAALNCSADAVAASTLWLFTEHTPASASRALQASGLAVRVG